MGLAAARATVYRVLEAEPKGPLARRFDLALAVLIVLNVAAVVASTVGDVAERYRTALALFEVVSVAVFTVEYVLRLWCVTEDPRYERPVAGRLRFAARPLPVVDVLAVLPTYLGVFFALDLRFARVLRLLRMFKLTRHSAALALLGRVLHAKRGELLLALWVFLIALVFGSSVMYFLEHEAQPETFATIPHALWWGVVTMATVGYGDAVPVTALGRVGGAVFILLGIAIYALPVAIMTSGFTDEIQKRRESATCPHCGVKLK